MNGLPGGFSNPIPLGQGGQARVYLAWQDVPGRWVVLKVARRSMGESLRREGELLSRLGGSVAPALLDQNLSVSEPWLAMSWVEGIPLDRLPATLATADRRALLPAIGPCRRPDPRHEDHPWGSVYGESDRASPRGSGGGGLRAFTHGKRSACSGRHLGGAAAERFEGGAPGPRWDVFALGVVSLRLIQALPPGDHTRDSWRELCASGELSRWARGRSWTLSWPCRRIRPSALRMPPNGCGSWKGVGRSTVHQGCASGMCRRAYRCASGRQGGVGTSSRRRCRGMAIATGADRAGGEPEPLLAELAQLQAMERKSPRNRWMAVALAMVAAGSVAGWFWMRPADPAGRSDGGRIPSPPGPPTTPELLSRSRMCWCSIRRPPARSSWLTESVAPCPGTDFCAWARVATAWNFRIRRAGPLRHPLERASRRQDGAHRQAAPKGEGRSRP
ncbi:MAG: hypothetical protein IPN71_09725 [Fibrobacteres bacterium]|nr:hypothetical protein [Fibrobacterota bacterium]